MTNGPGASAHEHTEECAELFREWRRYHAVAADEDRHFTAEHRLAAAHERDMFRRQLDALGCDPLALLALEAAVQAGDEADSE